jgi:hypothetical protein
MKNKKNSCPLCRSKLHIEDECMENTDNGFENDFDVFVQNILDFESDITDNFDHEMNTTMIDDTELLIEFDETYNIIE